MFRPSIRQKIASIAAGLIVLAVITSALSIVLASKIEHLLDELTNRYIPAYDNLARMDAQSVQRGMALQRMAMAKMHDPPDNAAYDAALKVFQDMDPMVDQEAAEARNLINAIIGDASTPSDNAALGRIDDRIDQAVHDLRQRLGEENATLIQQINDQQFAEARKSLARADKLRDEFTLRIKGIRADMLAQVHASAETVMENQKQAIVVSAIVTGIASILGFVFAMMIGSGITGPVMRLLEGTRQVEAGLLDNPINVTTRDEIGQLSAAFNRMIERLRHNQRIRETFGRYIDPRVADGLLDQPALAATEGQRRIMTVMFCDMKGFTALSEGYTPQGLVKIMNLYLSTMSEPIHEQLGIIDKYIGDGIMAYWGPPFVDAEGQAGFACRAAVEMMGRVERLRKELPELLGVRTIPADCDIRIGIATGDALVGSIGSEFMMSYTVMGDTVNLASRLEGANKAYGSRCLVSATTAAAEGVEVREIDRLIVVGQTQPQTVFEVMGRAGELAPQQEELRSRYAEGLAAYRAGRWEEARAAFARALQAVPDDGPSMTLAARVEGFMQNPPAKDWDGAWQLDQK
jgi:class 3 adenylate cyclase